jgi:hypothetical protein
VIRLGQAREKEGKEDRGTNDLLRAEQVLRMTVDALHADKPGHQEGAISRLMSE